MPKTPLCYAPWINLLRKNKSMFAPCCVISERYDFESYDAYVNSEWLIGLKETLLNGEYPDDCSYCKNRALIGLVGDDKMYNDWFDKCDQPLESNEFPAYIDLRFSNTCNLKCRMCTPDSSSKIFNEYEKDKDSYNHFYKERTDISSASLSEIKGKHIIQMKLLGGEPTVDVLMHEHFGDFLKYNTVDAISFTTNATNLNNHFIKLLEPIKNKHVRFSIDATGKTYEYIRTNAKWDNVSRNIINAFEQDMFTKFSFNVVLTPYNSFNITDLLDWFLTLHNIGYKFDVQFDDSCVDYTSLSCLTMEHLTILKQSLNEWIDLYGDGVECIYNAVKTIIDNVEPNDDNKNEFAIYNTYLDHIRNTDITTLDERFSVYTQK